MQSASGRSFRSQVWCWLGAVALCMEAVTTGCTPESAVCGDFHVANITLARPGLTRLDVSLNPAGHERVEATVRGFRKGPDFRVGDESERPARGVTVEWRSVPEGVLRVEPATAQTDGLGVATATVYAQSYGQAVVTASVTAGPSTVYAHDLMTVTVDQPN